MYTEINVIRADMTQPLPFENDSFDLIFHPVSNCYIEDVMHVWKECYRILKKGGRLMAGLDNGFNYLFDDDEREIKHSLPFNPLQNQELLKVLEKGDDGIQFSSPGIVSGGIYTLAAKCSGKVLDVKDASYDDGARMQQWTNYTANNQRFRIDDMGGGYYKLTAIHSGKCLDLPYGAATRGLQLQQCYDNGAVVQQWTDNGSDAQKWYLTRAQ